MNVAWDYREGSAAGEPGVVIDPAFARVAEVTDAAAVRRVVCAVLGLDPARVPVEVIHVSHVPGRELRAVYRLPGDPGLAGPVVRVDLHVPGWERAAERARSRAADPECVAGVAAWEGVAWRLPEDERLPALRGLLAPGAAAALRGWLTDAPVAGDEAAELLGYVPRRRAAVRIGGVVAKLGRLGDEADCHRRQAALYGGYDRGFALPRPLGCHEAVRVESAIPGTGIDARFAAGDRPDAWLPAVAAAMAALHRAPAPQGTPRLRPAGLLDQIAGERLARITSTLPDLAPRIEALARRLRAHVPADDGAAATLHGDLHPANVLVGEPGLSLIDFDDLRAGPPAHDLATFAGRLILIGLKEGRGEEAIAAAASLPGLYRECGGVQIRGDRFAWHLAARVLGREVAHGVRRLAPRLPQLATALLDVADDALAAAPPGR